MTERIPKSVLIGAAIFVPVVLAYVAYTRPGYFTSQACLVGLLLEVLIAAVSMYRRVFFPIMLMAFLLAGVDLPVGFGWAAARWLFLAVGATVGFLIMLKDRRLRFGLFHMLACFAVLTALISAFASRYSDVALLKALSLFLLFVYGSTGVRLAATGRESRFIFGLLTGVEIFVGVNAAFYTVGIEAMGNPNSLGAVMGFIAAPILLWGALVEGPSAVQRRRWVLYGICMGMALMSHARAGLAAALISCGLLSLALRRYKLIIEGLVVILILVAAVALFRPQKLSAWASSVIYKAGDQELGVLGSRKDPWHTAIDNIRSHFWFGTGIGTTASGQDASEQHAKFLSTMAVTAENGSSYLSIIAGVGMLGVPPFFLLLVFLANKVFRTVSWMLRTRSPSHLAIPLALVMIAGMVHASFEDWMFAPGNYLCVFFWSLAFVFADVAPSRSVSGLVSVWSSSAMAIPTHRHASSPLL